MQPIYIYKKNATLYECTSEPVVLVQVSNSRASTNAQAPTHGRAPIEVGAFTYHEAIDQAAITTATAGRASPHPVSG